MYLPPVVLFHFIFDFDFDQRPAQVTVAANITGELGSQAYAMHVHQVRYLLHSYYSDVKIIKKITIFKTSLYGCV